MTVPLSSRRGAVLASHQRVPLCTCHSIQQRGRRQRLHDPALLQRKDLHLPSEGSLLTQDQVQETFPCSSTLLSACVRERMTLYSAADRNIQFSGLHRTGEQVSLGVLTAMRIQPFHLGLGFDTLGHHRQTEPLRHRQDGPDQRLVRLVVQQPIDETLVDLECLERKVLEVAQGRIARAEVIDQQPDAEFPHGIQPPPHRR